MYSLQCIIIYRYYADLSNSSAILTSNFVYVCANVDNNQFGDIPITMTVTCQNFICNLLAKIKKRCYWTFHESIKNPKLFQKTLSTKICLDEKYFHL